MTATIPTTLGGGLKRKLAEGPCFGSFVKLGRPEVAEIYALSGFDFLICDLEHAPMTELEARAFIKASVALDVPVVVRLPEPEPGTVNRLLEAGAVGIQMPRLKTADEVARLRDMSYYPPIGRRSIGTANLLGEYGSLALGNYIERANDRMLTIGQFETREIDDDISTMTADLDIAFIGPADLSLDFGFPGKFDAQPVLDRIAQVERAAAGGSTVMGIAVRDAEACAPYIQAGYRYLAVGNDIGLLAGATRSVVLKLTDLVEELKATKSH